MLKPEAVHFQAMAYQYTVCKKKTELKSRRLTVPLHALKKVIHR
jgi:hypothetical protein